MTRCPFQRCVVRDPEKDEVYARYRAIDGGNNKFKEEIFEGVRERGDVEEYAT